MRFHANDGRENEDWFGWGADVLAPCDCVISEIEINETENKPGQLGKPPASWITFERNDGVFVSLVHIAKPRVSVGDIVAAGDVVASVGNNGYSRQPHIHIGAWKDDTPYQIRFDQTRMGSAKSVNVE